MNTVHELIRDSAQAQERAMARIERPSLHGRVKVRRAVRHARVAVGATVGVGALAVGSALVMPTLWSPDHSASADLTPAGRPALPLAADGSLLAEIPSENVVVDVYLDPMCPICAEFATTIEPDLLAMEGVTVVYRPISFLDRASSDGSYSTRAASAIQEVAARAPERLGAFLDQLWEHQPAENTGTLTDAELGQLALDAGVPADVAAMFPQHRFADAVRAATEESSIAGVLGTPTVLIDGEQVEFTADAGWETLVARVQQAVDAKQLINLTQAPSETDVPATVSATAPAYSDVPATASASAPASTDPSVSQAP